MEASAHLAPIGGPTPVTSYLVRIWTPGRTALAGWSTADWWLSEVASVEEAIAWARERAAGSPCEVLLADDLNSPLRLWGAEPEGASTTISIPLFGSADSGTR